MCFLAGQPPACPGAWLALLWMQDLALPLVDVPELPVSPAPVTQAPLDGSTTLWCIRHPSQLCVIISLAEVMLSIIIQIINDGFEQDWTLYWPLGCTATFWPPTGLHATGDLSSVVVLCGFLFGGIYRCFCLVRYYSSLSLAILEVVRLILVLSF